MLGQPRDERARRLELAAHDLPAARLVQPRRELMATVNRQLLQAQEVDARVVGRVAARRALERRSASPSPASVAPATARSKALAGRASSIAARKRPS